MQLSPGSWSILVLAICSSIAISLWPIHPRQGEIFWTFSLDHAVTYDTAIRHWNNAQPNSQTRVNAYVIGTGALGRRLQSGFLSGTPVPDLVEVESSMVSNFFSGPLDAVGFTDLTDRIHEEGLDQQINPASFSPWTNRGRIFGLPHDVHPVLLAYRADVVEAAGIDVTKIQTWDDFTRIMEPLVRRDSQSPRYLLNVWDTNQEAIEILLLQAGGTLFDQKLRPTLDSDINARVLSTIVSWIAGPKRICMNAPDFDAEGNYLFLHGNVLCSLMPDWLSGVWMKDLPGLGGKVKLMPLPAWERGGLRTSVYGGTMLGIPKRTHDFEQSWKFAKHLYLDPAVARALFRDAGIISPVRAFWSDPAYDQPNPYFSNQPTGRLYIQMAPQIPLRTSSPYKPQAVIELNDALIELEHFAQQSKCYDVPSLLAQAHGELAKGQKDLERQIRANAFLSDSIASTHE
jgi:arabinosaccharide transport system substrate-binding protein